MDSHNTLSYDLTHPEGMTHAIGGYSEWNPANVAVVLAPFMLFLPEEVLGPSFSETVRAMVHAFWKHSGETVAAQRVLATEIIKAAKEVGISKVNITLHPAAGIAIGKYLEEFPLKLSPGRQDEMLIEVEYKSG